MQTQSKTAHIGRSAVIAAKFGLTGEQARDLDTAVEFCVFERKSIAEAVRDFGIGLPVIGSIVTKLPVTPKVVARLKRTSNTKMLADARKSLLSACFPCFAASKNLEMVWDHSQRVAGAARDLAVLAGINPETAWTAGLLHDIGRIAFSTQRADRQAEEQDWLAAGFPAVYAETLAYGEDHARFGAGILRQWGLPGEIVEAIELHHRPECSGSQLSALLCLAEDLSEDLWPDMRRLIAHRSAGIPACRRLSSRRDSLESESAA